jgi:hypothetical protein
MGVVAVVMIILVGACLVLTRPYHTGQATHGIVRSPWETTHANRRGIVDVPLTLVLWRCIHWPGGIALCLVADQQRSSGEALFEVKIPTMINLGTASGEG